MRSFYHSDNMGIKLGGIVQKHDINEKELKDKAIAFDGYNVMYQFISSIRDSRGYPLTSKDGKVVSHLKGLFNRNCHMIRKGIMPVFVLDGRPHDLKSGILKLRRERKERAEKDWQSALEEGDLKKARMKAQQTSKITNEMIDDVKYLLDMMGIPVVMASSEGEAQAAYMCSKGDVYAAASQDYDSILFGASRLVRNLGVSDRRKLPGRNEWIDVKTEMINLSQNLSVLGISREQLIDIAILVGTDFNEGVRGIGPKKALEIIKEYGAIEDAVTAGIIIPIECSEVRDIFLRPDINEEYSLTWSGMNREGILEFLCTELGFSRKGVESNLEISRDRKDVRPQSNLEDFL